MKALYEEAVLEVLTATWESLEAMGYKAHFPGRSMESLSWKRQLYYRLLGPFGARVERSYDGVTIGRKAP